MLYCFPKNIGVSAQEDQQFSHEKPLRHTRYISEIYLCTRYMVLKDFLYV